MNLAGLTTLMLISASSTALAVEDSQKPPEAFSTGVLSCSDGNNLRQALIGDQLRALGHKLTNSEIPPTSPRLVTFQRKVSVDNKTVEDCYHTVPDACDPSIYKQQLEPTEDLRSAEALRKLVVADQLFNDAKNRERTERETLRKSHFGDESTQKQALMDFDRTHDEELRKLEVAKNSFESDSKKRNFMCSCKFDELKSLTQAQASSGCNLPRDGQDGIKVLYREVGQIGLHIQGLQPDSPQTPSYSIEQLSCQWKQVPQPSMQPGKWEAFFRDDLHLSDLFNKMGLKRSKKYVDMLSEYLDKKRGTVSQVIPESWDAETSRQVKLYLAAHPELIHPQKKHDKSGVKIIADRGIGALFFKGDDLLIEGSNQGMSVHFHPGGHLDLDAKSDRYDSRLVMKYSTPMHF